MNVVKSIVPVLALGAAGFLTSCVVDPYYPSGGATTTTVTHYRPGYVVNTLPGGYRTETYGGVSYYRHNDVYYRRQGSRYVVVERPIYRDDRRDDRYDRHDDRRDDRRDRWDDDRRGPGYRENTTVIRTLPSGARVVTHSGTRYYESRGVYYRPASGGYVIVRSPF
jgi:hypothetical protein